jgi:transposase InsO family protein
MTGWTVPLHVGLLLAFDGNQYTIADIEGRRIGLRPTGFADGVWRQVDVVALLAHPSFRVLTPDGEALMTASAPEAPDQTEAQAAERRAHVQEVLTGYRHGSAALALEGEPRPQYGPGAPMMARYLAKAEELGVGESTVRSWVARSSRLGPLPAVNETLTVLDRADPQWVAMARKIQKENINNSRLVKATVLADIEKRLTAEYGADAVRIPSRAAGYKLLAALDFGTNMFTGSTKGKRSIDNRPKGVFGKLVATHPGEYVILDTNRLDVFAMEPVTCRWVQCELTVAMDLYSGCIVGLRLTPVSTKAIDVAGVLFETVWAPAGRTGPKEGLAYVGVPGSVLLPADKLVDEAGMRLLPSVAPEAIVFDHGKVYVSEHVRSICRRFQIDLQPARPKTPTDKPIERWFRTLGQGLLAALPGYKGPDVHSRGEAVEEQAYYFIHELEAIIRDWITLVYHRAWHRGRVVGEVPRLKMCPMEMLEHGVFRSGPLRFPAHRDLPLEFLQPEYVPIHHYGVEIDGLRYNGPGLDPYRGQRSTRRGKHKGRWEVAVDSNDISRVIYFKDPRDGVWHELVWEHAGSVGGPFSREAAVYTWRLATAGNTRFPHRQKALLEMLDRWGNGLTDNRAERRMALRIASTDRLKLTASEQDADPELPALARIAATQQGDLDEMEAPGGDDDMEQEVEAGFPGEVPADVDEDDQDYYADAWASR